MNEEIAYLPMTPDRIFIRHELRNWIEKNLDWYEWDQPFTLRLGSTNTSIFYWKGVWIKAKDATFLRLKFGL